MMRSISTTLLPMIFLFYGFCSLTGCSQEKKERPLLWGFAVEGYPIDEERIRQLHEETTISPAIISFYLQWPQPHEQMSQDPTPSLEAIWKSGAIPCITWEPMYYLKGNRETISYAAIVEEKLYDRYLNTFAQAVKGWGKPIILRFAQEMNLEEYHWGSDRKGYGVKSPELYRHLFRYVVTRLRQEGVTNIHWAFCPNSDSIPNNGWNNPSAYYPGDEYVDLLGMDGYDWTTNDKEGPTHFEDIFSPLYHTLKKIAPHKPIFVFETASASHGKSRQRWLEEAVKTARSWQLGGVIWFQVNKERKWKIGPSFGDDPSFLNPELYHR